MSYFTTPSQRWEHQFLLSKRNQLAQSQAILLNNQQHLHSLIQQTISTLTRARQAPSRIVELKREQEGLMNLGKGLLEKLRLTKEENLKMQQIYSADISSLSSIIRTIISCQDSKGLQMEAYYEELEKVVRTMVQNGRGEGPSWSEYEGEDLLIEGQLRGDVKKEVKKEGKGKGLDMTICEMLTRKAKIVFKESKTALMKDLDLLQ